MAEPRSRRGGEVGQQRESMPLLFDVKESEVTGPLSEFQMKHVDRDGIFEMVLELNDLLGTDGLTDSALAKTFDRWWPDLETALAAIRDNAELEPKAPLEPRTDASMLEEMLSLLRTVASTRSSATQLAQVANAQLAGIYWADEGDTSPSRQVVLARDLDEELRFAIVALLHSRLGTKHAPPRVSKALVDLGLVRNGRLTPMGEKVAIRVRAKMLDADTDPETPPEEGPAS
jgi:hypothetical protein